MTPIIKVNQPPSLIRHCCACEDRAAVELVVGRTHDRGASTTSCVLCGPCASVLVGKILAAINRPEGGENTRLRAVVNGSRDYGDKIKKAGSLWQDAVSEEILSAIDAEPETGDQT